MDEHCPNKKNDSKPHFWNPTSGNFLPLGIASAASAPHPNAATVPDTTSSGTLRNGDHVVFALPQREA